MMRIVLLGAPGSGKGTQAQRLQARYGVPQVSSGDLLRDAVARGTELGMKAKAVMDAGHLVSDDIVLALIRERLGRADAANGFILDGFPRNLEQANALDVLLDELEQPLDAVLLLDVRREALMKRLAGRRICPKCGTVYHVESLPPGVTTCQRDGAELYQRPDDREEVIGKRLEVYEAQTRPLVQHYAKLGLLRTVAGEGALDEVSERLEAAVLARPVPAGTVKVAKRKVSKRSAGRSGAVAKKSSGGVANKKHAASKKTTKSARKTARRQSAPAKATKKAINKSKATKKTRATKKTQATKKTRTTGKAQGKKGVRAGRRTVKRAVAKTKTAGRRSKNTSARRSVARRAGPARRRVVKDSRSRGARRGAKKK